MTANQWRRTAPERKAGRPAPEGNRTIRCEDDKPRVNILSSVPLIEAAGLSAGEMRILKIAGAILAMVIVGIVAFLVFGI
jgi:hypothetical protein